MSDIFREVDEDLRREQLKRLWNSYGSYVIGLAILIVAVTAGYRGWEYWRERQAQETGDRFVAALRLSADGKHDQAEAAFSEIAKNGTGGYPVLATFRAASEKASAGDDKGAVADFDAIAANSSAPANLRDMARLRSAMILVETASLADLQSRVGSLAANGNPWRHSAREVLGLAAWRANDMTTARKYFTEIASDGESPQDLSQRAQFMLSLIDAREGKPPAPAPAPPAAATPPAGATAPTPPPAAPVEPPKPAD